MPAWIWLTGMVSTVFLVWAWVARESKEADTTNNATRARLMVHPGGLDDSSAKFRTSRGLSREGGRCFKTSQSRSLASILAQGFPVRGVMFAIRLLFRRLSERALALGLALALCLEVLAWQAVPLRAQDQAPAPDQGQLKQETPPEAGGPDATGPYAIPKKKDEPPPPPPPERPKKIEGMPDYSIKVDVPLVTVPVSVTTKDGQFISNLQETNFKVFEDGVEQKVTTFNKTDAPITAVLLVEFASTNYYFMVDALNASYAFAQSLKKEDWVAVVSYDMKPHPGRLHPEQAGSIRRAQPAAGAGFFRDQPL